MKPLGPITIITADAPKHREKPGGHALIVDLRRDAPRKSIDDHVAHMGLGFFSAWSTRMAFRFMLLKRAYSQEQFRRMASETPFKGCEIREEGLGLEVSLTK